MTNEETPGWLALNEELARRHGIELAHWLPAVAFPAFAENRTVLLSRKSG